MTYKIYSYGGNVGCVDQKKEYKTLREAKSKFKELVKDYCEDWEIDLNNNDYDYEINYNEKKGYFSCGRCNDGVDIYSIIKVPEFENKIEKLLWETELELDQIEDAHLNYIYNLCSDDIYLYLNNARSMIDAIKRLLKKGKDKGE